MKAAIELHQLAEVRLPLPPPAMRAPLARAAPQPRRQHPPPQRFVIDRQPVFTRQMLGRQRRPEPLVDAAAVLLPDQRQHPLPQPSRPSPDSTRAPRCRCCSPFAPCRAIPPIQPLRLPVAHLHQRRRRPQRQRPRRDPRQHARPPQLPRTHRCPSQSTTSRGRKLRGTFLTRVSFRRVRPAPPRRALLRESDSASTPSRRSPSACARSDRR